MYPQIQTQFFSFNRWKAAMLCALFSMITVPALVVAQPGDDKPDVDSLQAQLKLLQSKIEAMQDSQDDPFGSPRVKSVGSQRIKRAPDPVEEDALHIRLYDLSDIFAVSPHYPAVQPNELASGDVMFQPTRGEMINGGFGGGGLGGGGLGGGGGGGVFNIQPTMTPKKQAKAEMMNLEAVQVSMSQLVAAIKSTVSPKDWGDDKANIQFLGNTLLITATDNMHQNINNLLNLFREHWGKLRTISVQTYWVKAAATETEKLVAGEQEKKLGAGVVNPELWDKFIADAKTEKRIAYAATLTGHNNQTLHTLSGRQKTLTLGAVPLESNTVLETQEFGTTETTSIVGFEPTRGSIHHGAALQVTPLATRGGNFVILDLHAKVNELIEQDDSEKPSVVAQTSDGNKIEVKLDSAEYVAYRLSTTLRCPKDQIVLAGGMSFDTTIESDQPDLYLFVKVTVHTIEEDQSDWSKISRSKPNDPTPDAK